MIDLTQEHDKAEALAQHLRLEITKDRVKYDGRAIMGAKLEQIQQLEWGKQYQQHALYIEGTQAIKLLLEIEQVAREMARREHSTKFFATMLEYVKSEFQFMQIEITDTKIWTRSLNGHRQDYSMNAFLSHLKAALPTYNNSVPEGYGFPKLPSDTVGPAVQVMLYEMYSDKIANLQERLAYRSNNNTDVNAFITGLLKIYYIEQSPENIAAFKHLIWSIKRKVFTLNVQENLFFCLHSNKQHMGKTTFFRKLLTGFEWAYSPSGVLTQLLRPTDHKAMIREKFLLDFQELSLGNIRDPKTGGVDESVVTALKSIISTDTVSGREMYLSTDSTERQTAVLVSSTNKNIWDVINDPSGMRRYWQFDIVAPKVFNPEFYLEANIYFENILDLYQAIDEQDNAGFYHPSQPLWVSMRNIQESYARENPFLGFMHAKGWELGVEGDPDVAMVSVKNLVAKYNSHLMERGDKPWTAKHIVWVISANKDIEPVQIIEGGKLREVYFMKGWAK